MSFTNPSTRRIDQAELESVLIDRALAGATDSFETLIARYLRPLFRSACFYLRNQADAEDVVQETVIKIYRSLPTFRREARFSTWISRILLNEVYLHRRKRARCPLACDATLDGIDPLATCIDERPAPDAIYELRQKERLLRSSIAMLPAGMKAVVVLCVLEGQSLEEAAARLNITRSAAKTKLYRARQLLVRKRREMDNAVPAKAA